MFCGARPGAGELSRIIAAAKQAAAAGPFAAASVASQFHIVQLDSDRTVVIIATNCTRRGMAIGRRDYGIPILPSKKPACRPGFATPACQRLPDGEVDECA